MRPLERAFHANETKQNQAMEVLRDHPALPWRPAGLELGPHMGVECIQTPQATFQNPPRETKCGFGLLILWRKAVIRKAVIRTVQSGSSRGMNNHEVCHKATRLQANTVQHSICSIVPSPPPCPSPPQGRTVPPHPRGNRHLGGGGGGTVHHSRPANSSITQLKIFFSACDFLLISYCSWAK